MDRIPATLRAALRPATVVVGHYGAGKTNFCINLASDLADAGARVTVIDLDVVNPYFRASEQREHLESRGVRLVAPVFAEAGSSLDVPSLTGGVVSAIEGAREGSYVLIDAGGDDAGATALGRYARVIEGRGHAVLYVANRFRNLVQDPADALENLREIEVAARLRVTGIVNNSHLKDATDAAALERGTAYAEDLAKLAGLPLVCTTVPRDRDGGALPGVYRIAQLVKTPWE